MEFQQAASAGHGLPVKHPYDGVFGGAVKVGARVEDYREIFGGNSRCSIPILDVPELNEGAAAAAASVDGRSSKVDYSKIFGGFGEADFAVPYDELVLKPKKGKKSSQDVARAQAEARSRSAQLEHPKFVEEKAVPPSQASFQTLDGTKQINMLYHKTDAGSKSGTNGTTHIAQLHAVPGYTFLIDENTPSRGSKGGKPVYTGLNDVHCNVNVKGVTKEDKTRRKVVSGPQPRLAAENTTKSASDFRKKSTHNRSFSNVMPFDAFDIGLDAHWYKMSPSSNPVHNLGNDKYSSGRSMNSKFGVSRSDASEEGDGNYSPPYFHEEVDANSVAATSAAAVRKAIEEAQVKIRIAKELMERKKSGHQSNVKTSFSNGMKAEKREAKRADTANRSTEKDAQETHEKKVDPKQLFASSPENNGMKASIVMPNLGYGKESVAEIAVEQINGTHHESKLEHWVEENENRKAGKLFFEPDVTEELKTTILESEQANNGKKLMPSASETEPKEEVMIEESFKKSEECDKKWKASEDTPKQEDDVRELDSEEEAFQGHMHTDDIKLDQEPHHQEQYQEEIGVVSKHEEVVQTHKMSCKQENYENELGMLQESEEYAEFEIHEFKDMTELNVTCEWIGIEDDQRESHRQVETENKLDEASMREENNGVLEEIDERKENGKVYSEGFTRVECEKEEKSWNQDKNNKEQNDAHGGEVTEKSSGEINEQEVIEMRFNVVLEKDENESKLKQDGLLEENKMLDKAKENEKQLEENHQMNGTEKRQEKTCEIEEIKEITSDIYQRLEDEKSLKTTPEAFRYRVRYLGEAADVCQDEENENPGGADEACLHEDLWEDVEVETADTVGEYGQITDANEVIIEPNEIKKELEAVEMANELEEEEKFEVTGGHDFIGINVVEEQSTDINKELLTGKNWWNLDETVVESDHKQHKPHVSENKRDDQEKDFSEMTHILDDHNKDVDQSEVGSSDAQNDSDFVFSDNEKWFGRDMESETYGDPENDSKGLSCEVEERNKDILGCGTTSNHEEDPSYFESFSEERCEENVTDMEVSEEISLFGKAMERPQGEKTIQESDMKEENHHNSLKMEESEPEENLQNKVKLEKEHRRKKDEEKEREMEKERERIAVERAIREARERAFAEARERAEKAAAERAAAEAHQRRMAESRQRSEKAYAQNNDKSAIEKASMEAKLKAERAAVERATAEARERALEKALSEKAASKARNQAASGDDRMKSSDQQYKGSGLSSSSSSNHDVPCSSSGISEANGESGQRCKAVSERHQRTAERAAKALAEKNMRDLLAQKEQAERNRLAETLDADVKRWASGKERNLRALLSTLQYILGPDSGWKAIPLTDLISTVAVKKAYRKATLFVHPDKLQQRGASIQQKYTCEKVFDLLKEAWNKFSADER